MATKKSKGANIIEIKHRITGSVLYSCEAKSLKDAVAQAMANRADLRGSDLRGSNLRGSDLRGSDLRGSDLRWSNLSGSNLPAPTVVLLATWEDVSEQLCADLMLFDSTNHPSPEAFEAWAHDNGNCPYSGVHVQRAANFNEDEELWGKGVYCRPYDLMARVLAEKCPEWSDEKVAEFVARLDEALKKASESRR